MAAATASRSWARHWYAGGAPVVCAMPCARGRRSRSMRPSCRSSPRLRAAGMYCALATNQNAYRARYISDDLDYAESFDHAFYSCEIGSTKPDPRFFRAVLDALRLPPDRVLFIDDRHENVASAGDAGMRATLLQPNGRLIQARRYGACWTPRATGLSCLREPEGDRGKEDRRTPGAAHDSSLCPRDRDLAGGGRRFPRSRPNLD